MLHLIWTCIIGLIAGAVAGFLMSVVGAVILLGAYHLYKKVTA
jgi:uncharacterized membrane protein YeaQ/YmgE (transglycosylase-associated protein family)